MEKRIGDDALRDLETIEDFLREYYYRTADVFHRVVRPLKLALERWANSDSPRARVLYEGVGIAVYAVAYIFIFTPHFGFGAVGYLDLPGDEDRNGDSSLEKRP